MGCVNRWFIFIFQGIYSSFKKLFECVQNLLLFLSHEFSNANMSCRRDFWIDIYERFNCREKLSSLKIVDNKRLSAETIITFYWAAMLLKSNETLHPINTARYLLTLITLWQQCNQSSILCSKASQIRSANDKKQ